MTWMITIDPGHGRMGGGKWDPGHVAGPLMEADLTWELARSVEEELQRSGARHRVLAETRNGLGLPIASRVEACPPNGTYCALHFDALPKPGTNGGRVYCGSHPAARELGERLSGVVGSWGEITSNRYRGCVVVPDSAYPELQREDAICVLVSPFSTTGPDALVYARRLSVLGRMLGGALASWATGRNPAIRCYQPIVAQRDVSRGPASRPLGEMFRGRPEEPRKNDTARQIFLGSPGEPNE